MKKGFSLVELLVSLVIISIVVVFISAFVLNLRDEQVAANIDVPFFVSRASISRTLNYDVIENEGISSVSITNSGKRCTITYKNALVGIVQINSSNNTLTYTFDGNIKLIETLNGNKAFGTITSTSDTITYSPKVLLKYTIPINNGSDVEVISYN